ncbi:hypothetical protein PoB_005457000 [Plakobranchus ocellatus]|uniref:Uncharacterized protein n=1 Tax=Plakobranchus ocellatus TaxID=259542 RepID=A0AAV4C9J9_9GAST|nr:hypothetical protein PoB_005457000 [Plakobranchus ocellatus]
MTITYNSNKLCKPSGCVSSLSAYEKNYYRHYFDCGAVSARRELDLSDIDLQEDRCLKTWQPGKELRSCYSFHPTTHMPQELPLQKGTSRQ